MMWSMKQIWCKTIDILYPEEPQETCEDSGKDALNLVLIYYTLSFVLIVFSVFSQSITTMTK
jgi:hypothetical protein